MKKLTKIIISIGLLSLSMTAFAETDKLSPELKSKASAAKTSAEEALQALKEQPVNEKKACMELGLVLSHTMNLWVAGIFSYPSINGHTAVEHMNNFCGREKMQTSTSKEEMVTLLREIAKRVTPLSWHPKDDIIIQEQESPDAQNNKDEANTTTQSTQ